jgi:hypothetical protein
VSTDTLTLLRRLVESNERLVKAQERLAAAQERVVQLLAAEGKRRPRGARS